MFRLVLLAALPFTLGCSAEAAETTYPGDIDSAVLGHLVRDTDAWGSSYEGTATVGAFDDVEVVFRPSTPFGAALRDAESRFKELVDRGPQSVLHAERDALIELARYYGLAERDAAESDVLGGWDLTVVVLFESGITLNYFGNEGYPNFDLRLELDRNWKPTRIAFDG